MTKRTKSGYSLVEVLIAMAITSIVLLTVVTLFYMGRRNVYSGKQLTYVVSVGTRALEDLSAMSSNDVLTAFAIDDQTPLSTVTVNGLAPGVGLGSSGGSGGQSGAAGSGFTQFTNSATRDSSACTGSGTPVVYTCTNDPNGYMAKWVALIDQSKLSNAQVGVVLTPRNVPNPPPNTCDTPPCPWTSARFLKIRVYVSWDEAKNRKRIAFFDTTKVNRD